MPHSLIDPAGRLSRRAWGTLLVLCAGLSIITTSFPEGAARNKALAIYTATGATGFSLGLVFGGLLTEIGWRWVFFLPVGVALVALLAAVRLVPAGDRPQRAAGSFDL